MPGLDDILAGGLIRERLYLLEGTPGTGKTTLGLQFLLEGARAGERGLYVTLSETGAELRDGAASHGWSLDAIDIFELVPPESLLDPDQQQSLLYASDLELGETTRMLLDAVDRTKPHRIVLDSLSEFRLLAQGSLRYRRQILILKHHFVRLGVTVLMLDDLTADAADNTVHSLAHGVLRLEDVPLEYGPERRRLRVLKYRGTGFRGGNHDCTITEGGVRVFPRLVSAEHHMPFRRDRLQSGVPELDALLGGGLERGTNSLLLGPSGTGKSLLSLCFALTAVHRGEKVVSCIFDEEVALLTDRMAALGLNLRPMLDSGSLILEQVDAAETTPGAFAHRLRAHVEAGASTVIIDSLNGYQAAMPGEAFLVLHMHELLQYLNRQGVSSFLTVAQHGLVGDMKSPVDITYLADTVLLLRYFEAFGRVRRALSVVKKRSGRHEDTIREFRIAPGGIQLGQPLEEFQGVLRGVPTYIGRSAPLLADPAP